MSQAQASSDQVRCPSDLSWPDEAEPGQASPELDLAGTWRRHRPPAWLLARLHSALTGLAAHPSQEAAIGAIAARHSREPDEVLLVNGAAEAFVLLARALSPGRAACVYPAATGPEAALRAAGHEVGRVLLAEPFELDPATVPGDARVVVVGNPANPTGTLHPAKVLEQLAEPGRTLVIDESLADVVAGEPVTFAARRDLPGVVVVRSLTHAWGLAGLRAAYLLGEPELVAALGRAQPSWPVNALALQALTACSQPAAVAWARDQARLVGGWRASLAAALSELPGVAVDSAGQAPFLLLQVPDGIQARTRLAKLGVAVRSCEAIPGLGRGWIRVAVPAPDQHARVVDAMARCVSPAWHSVGRRGAPTPHVRTGRVTLVGAGPGSVDLITLRGWQALHDADVVISDRLADPGLTCELRPGVLLIKAGKAPGKHQLSQDEITAVLITHARSGRHVVRLKGGDPFVFGRGGEEVLACSQAGISCTVIPGLSSVTAAPALAGIPLTHRGVAQSFTVVSGHLPPGHPDSPVDWAGLGRPGETLVLLMAVANLTSIARHLIGLGRPASTAVACIERAATQRQQVTRSTLGDLARADQVLAIENPAVVVIGPTVHALAPVMDPAYR
jgi:histidinol-phosphate aminotransferase